MTDTDLALLARLALLGPQPDAEVREWFTNSGTYWAWLERALGTRRVVIRATPVGLLVEAL